MGDTELSDHSHQERLHLDNPIQKAVFSVPGEKDNIKAYELTRIATRCSS